MHEEPKLASDVPISKGFSTANKLTIWQKSLLFNGRGYTVYDNSTGELIFRVDNYASDWRVEMFLMDSTGNVLFTIKRSRKVDFPFPSSPIKTAIIICNDLFLGPW